MPCTSAGEGACLTRSTFWPVAAISTARLGSMTTTPDAAPGEPPTPSASSRSLTNASCIAAASNRGISVLPDWVVREVRYNSDYVTRPLTENGVTRRLYAAVRESDAAKPFMSHALRLMRSEPLKLQRRAPEAV